MGVVSGYSESTNMVPCRLERFRSGSLVTVDGEKKKKFSIYKPVFSCSVQ